MGVTEGLAVAEESNDEAKPGLINLYMQLLAPCSPDGVQHGHKEETASVGTSPQELCSRWGTRAELPETFPWWRIGAAKFVWPLFSQPGLLAGEKSTSPASSHHLSFSFMYNRTNTVTFT
jgi:hypothetical protein